MTRDQQQLAIWCGAAAVLLIVAGVVFSTRGTGLEESRTKADALYGDYRKLYPDQGIPADEAMKLVQLQKDHQAQARKDAESRLVATLPIEYQRSGVNDAAAKLGSDITALKQRAERQKIVLPSALPYESGLDQEPAKSSQQLATLFLYKQVLDTCMDSGVTKVKSVKEGKSHRDASGLYAVLTCDIAVEGTYEALSALLDNLRTKHDAGIGIHDVHFTQGSQQCTIDMTTSLIIVSNPAWQLAPEGGAPRRPTTGAAAPAAEPVKRTRLGGG